MTHNVAGSGLPMRHELVPLGRNSRSSRRRMRCFELHAALVVFEVEAVDGVLGVQPREAKAAFDGATVAGVQFQVGERLQGLREARDSYSRVRDHLIQLAAHRRQAELIQFQMEGGHGIPFGNAE